MKQGSGELQTPPPVTGTTSTMDSSNPDACRRLRHEATNKTHQGRYPAHDNAITSLAATVGYRHASIQGRQRHWHIGGSQVERRRRQNRAAVGGEGGWGLGRGCAPSQKIYEFFISKWCDMMHMKMTATCGIRKFR